MTPTTGTRLEYTNKLWAMPMAATNSTTSCVGSQVLLQLLHEHDVLWQTLAKAHRSLAAFGATDIANEIAHVLTEIVPTGDCSRE